MTQAIQTLADRGIESRVVEVVIEQDEAVEFAYRLLRTVDRALQATQVTTYQQHRPPHLTRVREIVRDLGLTAHDTDRLVNEFEAEALLLVRKINHAVSEDVHSQLRTFCSVHLIPRLHKETLS